MTAKELIRNRNLKFLHPSMVKKSDDENVAAILKAVGYFRNFKIFKILYTLLYKGKNLNLDQYRDIFNSINSYKDSHPKDFFIDGFSMALAKSKNTSPEVKAIYAVMIYNQLYKDSSLFDSVVNRTGRKLEKAVSDFYNLDRAVNVAIIRNAKVLKIGNGNLVKSVSKWTHYTKS